MGLEGHGLSTTGLGQRQEKAPPPSLLGGAQPRTGSTWPWRGDDAELEARPAVSRGAP